MRHHKQAPYLFILPFFLFFILFRIIPLLRTLIGSFSTTVGGFQQFIGVSQYIRIIGDATFWQSVLNTALLLLFYLSLKLPLLIVLSHLIVKLKNKRLILLLIYAPSVVGMFAYAIIFRYLFTYAGVVNQAMALIGLPSINWFGNMWAARIMLVFALLWGGFGFYILLMINGMRNIPSALYEVVELNGGTFIQKTRFVILPMLRPVIHTIVLLSFVEVLTLVDIPINLTRGGPQNATMTLSYYIYKQGIEYGNFSYASAISMVMILIAIIVLISGKKKEALYYEIY